jgi:hypothetical protein
MARARNIKPKFFKNDDLADLGPLAQLLFAGLWCLADKDGRMEDKPRFIKAEIFPYYECDVNGELTKLERLGFVKRYTTKGIGVIEVLNFKKHQTPHHTEKASELPAEEPESAAKPHGITTPEINGESTVNSPKQDGENPPDSLIPDSLSTDTGLLIPDAAPEPVASAAPKKSRATAKTSLPNGFCISDRVMAWAVEKGHTRLDQHFENFVGACKAKGYTYADWDEGFMGAIRNDWAKVNGQPRASPDHPTLGKAGQVTAANAQKFLEASDADQ